MTTMSERVVAKARQARDDDDFEPLEELEIAEYLIFLLALDTYMRYVEETLGRKQTDSMITKGVQLIRMADAQQSDAMKAFLSGALSSSTHQTMLNKAFSFQSTQTGLGKRSLQMRTLLSRGGASTMRAVFKTNKALQGVRAAIAASQVEDADAALDQFAALQMRNQRLRQWIDDAADHAGSGTFLNAVAVATDQVEGDHALTQASATAVGAGPSSDQAAEAQTARDSKLLEVEQQATATAARVIERSGQQDTPPNRSEVVGIATAVAKAVTTNAVDVKNLPGAIKAELGKHGPPDPEQVDAAMTDGKVLVAASAGSGKSTTLVARIRHLVEDRGVPPSKILAVSFNKKAADELKAKIERAVGPAAAKQMTVGTMNAIFKRFIAGSPDGFRGFGSPEEKAMMSGERFISPPGSGRGPRGPSPSSMSVAIRNIFKECDEKWDVAKKSNPDAPHPLAEYTGFESSVFEELPQAKKMNLHMTRWQGNDIGLDEAKKQAAGKTQKQAVVWYAFYQGVKGDLGPNWQPPCGESKAFGNFKGKFRRGGERLGDFNDQLKIMRDIMARDPKAKKAFQGKFDHLNVDECVHEDTQVETPEGPKSVRDLEIGEEILSYDNGSAAFKLVENKVSSTSNQGYRVHLASGRTLEMTAKHRLYATPFEESVIPEGELALYLMYRKDMGFRIGVSKNPTSRVGARTPRAATERADCLWILDVGESSDILFKEQAYSLKYAIPTYLFEGSIRGCSQDRIDKIFSEFGENGRQLLDKHDLDFHYPHWVNSTMTGSSGPNRFVVGLQAHRKGKIQSGSAVQMSWTGDEIVIPDVEIRKSKESRRHFSKRFASYAKARKMALHVAREIGARVDDTLMIEGEKCRLVTASALFAGMKVPVHESGFRRNSDKLLRGTLIHQVASKHGVDLPARGCVSAATYESVRSVANGELPPLDDSEVSLDEITCVEMTEGGSFVDLTVEAASNFFGNGVLSHNCQDLNSIQHEIFEMGSEHITEGDGKSLWMVGDDSQAIYQFRGARPEMFVDLDGKEGWKTKYISTNYRCAPEIVEHAGKLIAHNEDRIPLVANPHGAKPRGEASVRVDLPGTNAEAAINTVGRIRKDMDDPNIEGKPQDYAVLARTNKELNDFETACIINEIPYVRKGGNGFLDAPESKAVLGYIDLAGGTDYEKKMDSLLAVLMNPDRGLYLGPDKVARAVKEAIDDVARSEGVDAKAVDPTDMVSNHEYASILAENLKRPYKLKITRGKGGDWLYDKLVGQLADDLADVGRDIRSIKGKLGDGTTGTAELIDYILDNSTSTKREYDRKLRREVETTVSLREHISDKVALFGGEEEDDASEEAEEVKPEFDAEGNIIAPEGADEKPPEDQRKGLGSVQFLYALAEPNGNDIAAGTDPAIAKDFLQKIQRFEEMAKTLRVDPRVWSKKMLQEGKDPGTPPPAVTLSTVHSVKGAEWENVTVVMPKGKFPHEAPPPKPGEEDDYEPVDIKAERNLAYVALTRAAKNLEVVCPQDSVKGRPGQPPPPGPHVSRFVIEADLNYGENVPKEEVVVTEDDVRLASDYDIEGEFLRFASQASERDRWMA